MNKKKYKYNLYLFLLLFFLQLMFISHAQDENKEAKILAKPTLDKIELELNKPALFAISAVNNGKPVNVTVTPERSNPADFIVLSICETNSNGACKGNAYESIETQISDKVATFAIFVVATKPLLKNQQHAIQVKFINADGNLLWKTDTKVITI